MPNGPGGREAGRLYIKIVPDTSDFNREKIQAELQSKTAGLDVVAEIKARLQAAGLAAEVEKAVKKAEAEAGAIDVDLDVNDKKATSKVDEAIARMQARMRANELDIKMDVKTEQAMAQADAAIARMNERIGRDRPEVTLGVDAATSQLQLASALASLDAIAKSTPVQILTEVDKSSVAKSNAELRLAMGRLHLSAPVTIDRNSIANEVRKFAIAESDRIHLKAKVDLDDQSAELLHRNIEHLITQMENEHIDVRAGLDEASMARVRAAMRGFIPNERWVDIKFRAKGLPKLIGETVALNAALAAATSGVVSFADEQNGATSRGVHGWYALLQAILPLTPALVPIGGAALGAASALGAMGAAGAVAGYGIYQAIKQNTELGRKYKSQIDGLKSSFDQLAANMAGDMFTYFQKAVASLNEDLPALSSELRGLGKFVGSTLYSTFDGLTGLFIKMGPIFTQFATGLDNTMRKFDSWAHSAGADNFVSAISQQMHDVNQLLSSLGTALVKLIKAFSPAGTAIVEILDGISKAISAIPTPVLTAAATGLTAMGIAGLALKGLNAILLTTSGGMLTLAASSKTMAASIGWIAAIGLAANELDKLKASAQVASVNTDHLARSMEKSKSGLGGINQVFTQNASLLNQWTGFLGRGEEQTISTTEAVKRFGEGARAAFGNDLSDKIGRALHLDDGASGRFKDQLHSIDSALAQMVKNGQADKAAAALKRLEHGMDPKLAAKVTGALTQYKNALDGLGPSTERAAAKAREGLVSYGKLGTTMGGLATISGHVATNLGTYQAALSSGNTAAQNAALAQLNYKTASEKEKQAIDNLNNSLSTLLGMYNSQVQSAADAAHAQTQVKNALKESKGSLNAYTDSGYQSISALDSWDSKLRTVRDNVIKTAKGTRNGTARINDANAAYRNSLSSMLKYTNRVYGVNSAVSDQIRKFIKNADAINGVPKKSVTKVSAPGADSTRQKMKQLTTAVHNVPKKPKIDITDNTPATKARIRSMVQKLNGIPGHPHIGITDNSRKVSGDLSWLQRRINSLRGKNIYVTTYYRNVGTRPPGSGGGRIPTQFNATGSGDLVNPFTTQSLSSDSLTSGMTTMSTFSPSSTTTDVTQAAPSNSNNQDINIMVDAVQAARTEQASQMQAIPQNLQLADTEIDFKGGKLWFRAKLKDNSQDVYAAASHGQKRRRK